MDLLAHPVAERGVDELMLADLGQTLERRADDHGLPVLAVAADLDMLAAKRFAMDVLMDSGVTMGETSRDGSRFVAPTGTGHASPARSPFAQ